MREILITGSEGLIGRALTSSLERRGYAVRRCDLRAPPGSPARIDVLASSAREAAVRGCAGVVHLAAVSRVIRAERDPHLCWRTNTEGTRALVETALAARGRPWILFASSREVYGEAPSLPVTEGAPLTPVNVYGRSKGAGEEAILGARQAGLSTAVVRLSNVYGATDDHPDRVVPAFARAAASGAEMRVDGRDHVFDFTHLGDTILGISTVIDALEAGEAALPPIQLVTGTPTTLGALAELANAAGGERSRIVTAPSRDSDVSRFYGDPSLAHRLLGWRAEISIEDGVRRLVSDFKTLLAREIT